MVMIQILSVTDYIIYKFNAFELFENMLLLFCIMGSKIQLIQILCNNLISL